MQAVNASQGDCISLKNMYFCWLRVEAAEGMSGLMVGEHLYNQLTGLQLRNPLSPTGRQDKARYIKKTDMA